MGLNFFKTSSKRFGVEITENHLRLVEVSFEGSGISLVGAIELPLPEGTVRQGKFKNISSLANNITEARLKAQPNPISASNFCLSLPNKIVTVGHITVPSATKSEARKIAIKKFAEASHLELKNNYFDLSIVANRKEIGLEFLCSAASIENIQDIIKISRLLGISPLAIEPAVLANGRVCASHPSHEGRTITVSIDHNSSSIALWAKGQLLDMKNLSGTGLASILEDNGIRETGAEYAEIKKLHLESDGLRESLNNITEGIISVLTASAAKQSDNLPITKIILSGPGAYLPKIDYILEKEFRISTTIKTIKFTNGYSIGPEFITAFGLAQRSEV